MCYDCPLVVNSDIKIYSGWLLIGLAIYLYAAFFSLVNLATVPLSCNGHPRWVAGSVMCVTWWWLLTCFDQTCLTISSYWSNGKYLLYRALFMKLEGSAPYGGQTSTSCGGMVAFDHQMGALWAPKLGPFGPPGQIQIHINTNRDSTNRDSTNRDNTNRDSTNRDSKDKFVTE